VKILKLFSPHFTLVLVYRNKKSFKNMAHKTEPGKNKQPEKKVVCQVESLVQQKEKNKNTSHPHTHTTHRIHSFIHNKYVMSFSLFSCFLQISDVFPND
jgi:hypothetical protein